MENLDNWMKNKVKKVKSESSFNKNGWKIMEIEWKVIGENQKKLGEKDMDIRIWESEGKIVKEKLLVSRKVSEFKKRGNLVVGNKDILKVNYRGKL